MIYDLPQDLIEEILSRVPATSLKQLRRTCKRWNTIFNDNRFRKEHFDKSPKEFLFLMFKESRFVAIHDFDLSMTISCDTSHQFDISRVFQCNGLLLCNTKDNEILVWNPCTGQTRSIPPHNYKRSSWFALGYDYHHHSYKILRCCDNKDGFWDNDDLEDRVVEFEIYEFSSDSWKVVDDLTFNWIINKDGVSLKGKAYWLAFRQNKFLLRFDFTRESFECLNLPYDEYDPHCFKALSVVGEEKLAVLHHNLGSSKMEIWITNNEHQPKVLSWNKFFVMDLSYPWFWSCGRLFIDEKKKLFMCRFFSGSGSLHIFGEEDKRIKISFMEDSTYTAWCPYTFTYVPSLIQI